MFFQFVWQPYRSDAVRALIPAYCLEHSAVWRSSCPLLCMHIVEWHHVDRTLRQFGMEQHIPDPAVNLDAMGFHGRDLRGRVDTNWSVYLAQFVVYWGQRHDRVFRGDQPARPLTRNSEYWQWYRRITRRWMDPTSGSSVYAVNKS